MSNKYIIDSLKKNPKTFHTKNTHKNEQTKLQNYCYISKLPTVTNRMTSTVKMYHSSEVYYHAALVAVTFDSDIEESKHYIGK